VAGLAAGLLLPACSSPDGATSGLPVPFLQASGDLQRWEACTDPAAKAALDQALVEVQAGDDAKALPLLRQVIERCPELVRAHRLYQDTALQLGGQAAAGMLSYYAGLPDRMPMPAYVKSRLLGTSYEKNQVLEAILKQDSTFYWAHLSRGRLLRSSGRTSDAAAAVRRSLAQNSGFLEAHLELAEMYVELGRDREAMTHYENYLRGAPADLAVTRQFASLLVYRVGRPEQARPYIEKLLRHDPQDDAARLDLAAAEWRSGRPERALELYLEVLAQRSDHHACALLNVGYLYYDTLAKDEATRRVLWPKARKAFLWFLQQVRPEEGMDYVEKLLAVPYRLEEIEALCGPDDGKPPTLADLR
jgi:tetratricopeptide (TPR) repeat protein